MVEVNGLEPMTFPLSKRDALSLYATRFPQSFLFFGGGERDRTDDLLRAKQVLSQLSYTPFRLRRFGLRFASSPLALQNNKIIPSAPAIHNRYGGPSWN